MRTPPRILIVDDNEANRDILRTRLAVHGYDLVQAANGEEAIARARETAPDLILLDVMMPKLDGIQVCRILKGDPALPFMPIVLVTARSDSRDVVEGLEAGADEYLTKPVDQTALVARVKSVLRLKALHDQVRAQADDLARWNAGLERRVAEQLAELERASRLMRFLPAPIAELVMADGRDNLLESHRREVTVAFCDLRGFTAFSEAAEPEDVMAVLEDYHRLLGTLVQKHGGTLAHLSGDGVMVLFNDPVPCDDPCARGALMAVEMQAGVRDLLARWRDLGPDLGFGVGIAHGYATLGRIGFEDRWEYSAVGSVVNLAARLCAAAADDQVLIDAKVCAAIAAIADVEATADLALKGIQRRMKTFLVRSMQAMPR